MILFQKLLKTHFFVVQIFRRHFGSFFCVSMSLYLYIYICISIPVYVSDSKHTQWVLKSLNGANIKKFREKFLLLCPILLTSSISCVFNFKQQLSVSSNTWTKQVSCGFEWFLFFQYRDPAIKPYFNKISFWLYNAAFIAFTS